MESQAALSVERAGLNKGDDDAGVAADPQNRAEATAPAMRIQG